ncbi:MAG: hypothetical protein KDB60_00150, partial [Propionibacteriaceae bacterium]|nr:hypothetical protein [Propionibacteriaceae bacterium]
MRGSASARTPCRSAITSSRSPARSRWPRQYPANNAEPPVGSASTNNTGRGHAIAKPSAVVV